MALQYLGSTPNYRRLLRVLQTNVEMGTPFSNITKLEAMRITVVYQRGNLSQLYTFLQNGWPVLTPKVYTDRKEHCFCKSSVPSYPREQP